MLQGGLREEKEEKEEEKEEKEEEEKEEKEEKKGGEKVRNRHGTLRAVLDMANLSELLGGEGATERSSVDDLLDADSVLATGSDHVLDKRDIGTGAKEYPWVVSLLSFLDDWTANHLGKLDRGLVTFRAPKTTRYHATL